MRRIFTKNNACFFLPLYYTIITELKGGIVIMEKNIKIEFLSRWGIFKIAEYRYIINKKYGTAYQKATTSKSTIREQHITAETIADCYILAGGHKSDIIGITTESEEAFNQLEGWYNKKMISLYEFITLIDKRIEKIIKDRY